MCYLMVAHILRNVLLGDFVTTQTLRGHDEKKQEIKWSTTETDATKRRTSVKLLLALEYTVFQQRFYK